MILRFPNLDTLRLALTTGSVPGPVAAAAARATFDDRGPLWVEPAIDPGPENLADLDRFGIHPADRGSLPLDQAVACWAQLLPLMRQPHVAHPTDQAPVLFELGDEEQLAALASEILRLGNDRQGFRWLQGGNGSRALLHVVGPPFYSLLRAIDAKGSDTAAVAYREAGPRVWQQIGYVHPLAEHIRPPEGKLLLLRPPRQWALVEDAPFRDIYGLLDLVVPEPPTVWRDADLGRRWTVPLRLARGSADEAAELWVLRERAVEQVDELVRDADEQLLSRLAFAVGESAGRRTVVLRVRPSRRPPPVLVLDAVGFRPYLRLPNLFLPCGTRLQPLLRRDHVTRLVAADSNQVTWLYPHGDGGFTPETLPDAAFRPLGDWVDYILDQDREALAAWMQASTFDFTPFACADDIPEEIGRPTVGDKAAIAVSDAQSPSPPLQPSSAPLAHPYQEVIPPPATTPSLPGEAELELRALELEFLQAPGPLDAPQRQALWPRMARLNEALGQDDAAAQCWSHALWEADVPVAVGAAPDLEAILRRERPTGSDLRTLTVALLAAATAESSRQPLLSQIPPYLLEHERLFSVRALWLAWMACHRLVRGDVLSLTRARDRVLERLYRGGLSPTLDLPGFLRFSGKRGGERFRVVRERVLQFLPRVEAWLQRGVKQGPGTRMLACLMFAYGLAGLGETIDANRLLEIAATRLPARDEIHAWLFDAFAIRVRQAGDSDGPAASLPPDLLRGLNNMDRLARYKIDRLRAHSRILEKHERIDPCRRWEDERGRELAQLFDVADRPLLADRLNGMLTEPEPRVLATALELAPRLGAAFAESVLDRADRFLDRELTLADRALLLEKGLFLAAHYDSRARVQGLVARFHQFLNEAGESLPLENLQSLLGHTFRSLRKLGLRDEVGQLLDRLADRIQRQPAAAPAASGIPAGPEQALCLLLQVAAGWFWFGKDDRAWPILDQARTLLFQRELDPVGQTALACAYLTTLGQAPLDASWERIEELFDQLEGVADSFQTITHYSLSRLEVVEAALLALVGDDFAISPETRRLLDEDEYLVRRRIHRDVRQALEEAGL